jgi:hypothetical protein
MLVTLVQQVMLINAVKDVASALGDLIQATKAASGKSINDPSMNHLKDSAKVCLITTYLHGTTVITGNWLMVSDGFVGSCCPL